MSKPFFKRLEKYFSHVGKTLREESEAASIFDNKTDIGVSREHSYASFLKEHIPSQCNVFFGGFLFDFEGNESKQIDLIVTGKDALKFNLNSKDDTGKSFTCIDGCVAVVGIKSNLNSHELENSLDNFASLPQKRNIENRIDNFINKKKTDPNALKTMPFLKIDNNFYDDWPFKIIYASKGVGIKTAVETIENFYQNHSDIPDWKKPNMIHVAGNYVIAKIPSNGAKDPTGKELKPNSFHAMPEFSDAYGLLKAAIGIQNVASISSRVFYNYSNLFKNMKFKQDSE